MHLCIKDAKYHFNLGLAKLFITNTRTYLEHQLLLIQGIITRKEEIIQEQEEIIRQREEDLQSLLDQISQREKQIKDLTGAFTLVLVTALCRSTRTS